jgi:hypothetical protein
MMEPDFTITRLIGKISYRMALPAGGLTSPLFKDNYPRLDGGGRLEPTVRFMDRCGWALPPAAWQPNGATGCPGDLN